jgi:aminopeptidase N
MQNARSFALSVSPYYEVKTRQVGETTVIGYSFPVQTLAGEAALDTTARSLELFNTLFGEYSRPTLSVVEADFLDGMEYDGLYFLSNGFYNLYQGSPAEYLVAIAAHETAHQWWFGQVGNDQAIDPWLDEALCTYSERLYYENIAPEALPWWWTYRINYYNPSGYINGSIYSYSSSTDAYQAYRNAVYLNGAVFLEEVRKTMGDEAFFKFLREYASAYRNKIVSTAEFLDYLRSSAQADLQPLLENFVR